MHFQVAFDLELSHGRCVGVRLPEALAGDAEETARARLDPAEWGFAQTLAPPRRHTWVGGRVALREALSRLEISCGPIFATPRGAPALPRGVAASISHKERLAVALVARDEEGARGVDVELAVARRKGIARLVLTDAEQADLGALPGAERDRELLVRFSAKEAIYKAIDPFLMRYVGFKEVSLAPLVGGDARVVASFTPALHIEATWQMFGDDVILTTARARLL